MAMRTWEPGSAGGDKLTSSQQQVGQGAFPEGPGLWDAQGSTAWERVGGRPNL